MQHYTMSVIRNKSLFTIVIQITIWGVFGSIHFGLNAQNIQNGSTEFTNNDVHTVLFCRKGWELSFPAYNLNSDDQIVLRFDLMGHTNTYLDYTIYQYDANWTSRNTFQEQYLEGFYEQLIEESKSSVNTVVEFTNYSIEFPNDQLRVTQSGNYEIVVFESGNPNHVYLKRRFLVYEQKCSISAKLNRFDSDNFDGIMYFDATIDPAGLPYNDIHQQILVATLFNNDWHKLAFHHKYRLNGDGQMVFEHSDAIRYPGGNEYRMFSFKSLKQPSERVDRIEFNAYTYNIYLKDDSPRDRKAYFFQEDFNGLFYIETEHGWDDSHLESDYGNVHFTLKMPYPMLSNIYIYGALTNWETAEANSLRWNPELQQYEGELFLKQGIYSYRFLVKEKPDTQPDWNSIEGSFSETENNLTLWVYFRDYANRHDRLVGYEIIQSHP